MGSEGLAGQSLPNLPLQRGNMRELQKGQKSTGFELTLTIEDGTPPPPVRYPEREL